MLWFCGVCWYDGKSRTNGILITVTIQLMAADAFLKPWSAEKLFLRYLIIDHVFLLFCRPTFSSNHSNLLSFYKKTSHLLSFLFLFFICRHRKMMIPKLSIFITSTIFFKNFIFFLVKNCHAALKRVFGRAFTQNWFSIKLILQYWFWSDVIYD